MHSTPKQKRSLNPKRRTKRDRSVNRPLSLVDRTSRPGPTESWLISVGRPLRSTVPLPRSTDGRSSHVCARHAHRSIGRSIGFCFGLLQVPFLLPLTSDLCAISSISFYLLSPYKIGSQPLFKVDVNFEANTFHIFSVYHMCKSKSSLVSP